MSEFDRKFCGGCQSFKPLEGGAMKQTKSQPRWVCKTCMAKDSVSLYKTHKAIK